LGSLGSYQDKTKRLEAMVGLVGRSAKLDATVVRNTKRAAVLSKADLTTHLVYEFPELQGIAGSEYAKLEGEPREVTRAIEGQYLPASLTDSFCVIKQKLSLEGALLGICDRIDLIVGVCGLGIELNSSQDPYALRRAAGSIVKILRAHSIRLSLRELIRASRDQYGSLISKSHSDLEKQLTPFFKERVVHELEVKTGSREHEVLMGIFASGFDVASDIYEKFDDLTKDLKSDSFIRACKVMERTGNILKGVKEQIHDRVEPALFESPVEKNLFELVNRKAPVIQELAEQKRYGNAARLYGDDFYQLVHDFFDQVMVNVDDRQVRTNRQALVKQVNQICAGSVADLSFISNI
jgi:glycyl-tRNA synthetase beta chain